MGSNPKTYTPNDVRTVLQLLGESIAPRILTQHFEIEGQETPGRTRMCGGCGGTFHQGVVTRLIPPGAGKGIDADLKYRCCDCYARAAGYQLTPEMLERERDRMGPAFAQAGKIILKLVSPEDDDEQPVAAG